MVDPEIEAAVTGGNSNSSNINDGVNENDLGKEESVVMMETAHQLEVKFMLSVNKNKAKNECIQQ